MFKNRAAQISFVKTPKTDTTPTPERYRLNDAEIKLIKSTAKSLALTIVGMVVVIKVTDALCDIATNIAPKN